MSNMSRRALLKLFGGASATALLAACKNPRKDVDAGIDAPKGCGVTDAVTEIGDNHTHALHALVVPAADVQAELEKTYDIKGAASHSHFVTVSVADFGTLKAGGTVMITSTPFDFDGHTHVCTISCG